MPIYKDKKNNKYYFKIYIKGKQILRRGFETEEEAINALIDFRASNVVNSKNKKYPTFNFVCKNYLLYKKKLVKVSSHYCIEKYVNSNIIGQIRDVPVNDLINLDFEKYRIYLAKLDLAVKTKNRYINILKEIFNFCNIYYNYDCPFAKRLLLFKDNEIKKPKNDYRIFTYNDFKMIYPTLNDYDKLLLLTFYLFGLRIGEIMGLSVLSFSSFPHTLCVYREVSWKTNKKGFVLLSPKSKSSNRNYPVPEEYEKLINDHIKKHNLKDENFIFFGIKGKNNPLSEHAINTRIKKWSEIVGYHLHSHIFRHSAVSQLFANNVPIEIISSLVGHNSTEITETVYLHKTEEKKKALTNLMNELVKM